MPKFPVDERLFEDDTLKGITFSVEKGSKMFFKINDKIIKVLGDSKWEALKRKFGRMKD